MKQKIIFQNQNQKQKKTPQEIFVKENQIKKIFKDEKQIKTF